MDIREQLYTLVESATSQTVDEKLDPEEPPQLTDGNSVFRLLLSSDDANMFDAKKPWVVYGDCLFTLQERGLQKYSLTSLGGMRGRLLAFNYEFEEKSIDHKSSLLIMDGQLYLRHEGAKPAPFSRVDPETLAVTKMSEKELVKFPASPDKKAEPFHTLRWEPQHEKSGRCLEEA